MAGGPPEGRLIEGVLVIDSVTRFGPDAAGQVVVGGSHIGVYPGYLVAAAKLRGAVLSDGGVTKDGAGIAGLAYLDRHGVPAAACDAASCRIGDGADTWARGIVAHVNRAAAALGVAPGQAVAAAARLLRDRAPPNTAAPPPEQERRHRIEGPWGDLVAVWALDSISLVRAEDAGQIVLAGSHGALLGGRPETAVRVDVFAAVYNDAGGSADGAGFTRLPALDPRGIAGATVAGASARIGDGRSTYEDGVLSRVNATAARLGLRAGQSAREATALLAAGAAETRR